MKLAFLQCENSNLWDILYKPDILVHQNSRHWSVYKIEMEATVLGSLLSGALLVVSVLLLAGLCIGCRESSHRTSIPQHFSEDDYVQPHPSQPGFRVIRPTCAAPPGTSRGSGNSTHLTSLSSPMPDPIRRQSYIPPVEVSGGNSLKFESPGSPNDRDYVNEDDDDDDYERGEGYIEVLPDHPKSECPSQQSLASTQSSGQNYVNIESEEEEEEQHSDASSQNYINVQTDINVLGLIPGVPIDDGDSDNNSTSDYVNAAEVLSQTWHPD
ncbi:hypothetical protein AGOR_G00229640 [Albula goreensis]|uniref:Linker for activation of T-cells family member 1 n=1 Tax=Albula goreensis TaxID=1534307 RepID=A0A8T3CMI0_9TELE|nr:hypothetical protein AGOR_G00229640 [Albula goreensis]